MRSTQIAMNRSGNPPAEDIPLNTVRPDANDVVDGNGGKFAQKIDLHSYAGLTTILAVNLQQLYLLFTVGPELGPMFYILTTLSLISAVLVVCFLRSFQLSHSDNHKFYYFLDRSSSYPIHFGKRPYFKDSLLYKSGVVYPDTGLQSSPANF